MNTQNFNQSGGFPIKTQTLNEMQKSWSVFNELGHLAGNFAIISGCIVTGSTVSNGAVFINNEVLEFRGGQIGTTVIIVQEVTQKEFKDGSEKDVVFIRYTTFGIGVGAIPWVNFKRSKTTVELTEDKAEQSLIEDLIDRIEILESRPASNVPIGMIAIWDRPAIEIPIGWAEYLPLRGRLPIGMDGNYTQGTDETNHGLEILGNTGGKREHKLTKPELPNYNLTRNTGIHGVAGGPNVIQANEPGSVNVETFNSGGQDKAHTNMSPFRVVHFIKYTG